MFHEFVDAIGSEDIFSGFEVLSHFVITLDSFGGELNCFGLELDLEIAGGELLEEEAYRLLEGGEA